MSEALKFASASVMVKAVKEGVALGCVVEQKVRSSSRLSMLKTWGASLASEK